MSLSLRRGASVSMPHIYFKSYISIHRSGSIMKRHYGLLPSEVLLLVFWKWKYACFKGLSEIIIEPGKEDLSWYDYLRKHTVICQVNNSSCFLVHCCLFCHNVTYLILVSHSPVTNTVIRTLPKILHTININVNGG